MSTRLLIIFEQSPLFKPCSSAIAPITAPLLIALAAFIAFIAFMGAMLLHEGEESNVEKESAVPCA